MTLPVETLEAGINKTLFSAADDELRPIMNGVYFDIAQDSLTLLRQMHTNLFVTKQTILMSS